MHSISNGILRRALISTLAFTFAICGSSLAEDPKPIQFAGEKSTWHNEFTRYDFLMDDDTLEILPFRRDADERFGIKDPPKGKHRCVVIAPKQPARGNPW